MRVHGSRAVGANPNVNPRVDVYSLGVLLFQMLAGRLPFVAERPEKVDVSVRRSRPLELLDRRRSPPGYSCARTAC